MKQPAERSAARNEVIAYSLWRAGKDISGMKAAMESGTEYHIELVEPPPSSFLGALFNRIVKNSPDCVFNRHGFLEPADIVHCPAFEKFRDALNERGFDIITRNDCYDIGVQNPSYKNGISGSFIRLRIVPWDGVKKPLRHFDILEHIGRTGPARFY